MLVDRATSVHLCKRRYLNSQNQFSIPWEVEWILRPTQAILIRAPGLRVVLCRVSINASACVLQCSWVAWKTTWRSQAYRPAPLWWLQGPATRCGCKCDQAGPLVVPGRQCQLGQDSLRFCPVFGLLKFAMSSVMRTGVGHFSCSWAECLSFPAHLYAAVS